MIVAFAQAPDPDFEVVVIDGATTDELVIRAAQYLLPIVEPITLVGIGKFGPLIPRLAFARRAARQSVQEYLLVDCDLPVVSGDWPDAPVRYLARSEQFATHAKVAAERGWRVDPEIRS